MTLRRALRKGVLWLDRRLGIRSLLSERYTGPDLRGDRAIEYSWVIANLPANRSWVLDVGCVFSPLTAVCARLGHEVVSVDLQEIEYAMSNVRFVRGDINEVDVPRRDFDVIIACSVLEHIGLGGRFDSLDYRDGDLKAMKRLRQLLAPEGRLLVTVPVGVDAVVSPLHRIYGPKRLPRLLEPFCVAREEFWSKADGTHWQVCTREEALSTVGSARYYALGLFVLAAAKAGRPRVSEQCHCISGGPAVKQGF